MLGWFRCDTEVFDFPVVRGVVSATGDGDCAKDARGFILMRMFADCAGGRDGWLDANDIARMYHTTKRQAGIIWEVCLKHKVLRDTGKGYWSAREWMQEKGLCDFDAIERARAAGRARRQKGIERQQAAKAQGEIPYPQQPPQTGQPQAPQPPQSTQSPFTPSGYHTNGGKTDW